MVHSEVSVRNLITILKELIILKNTIKKSIFYFKILLFSLNYVVFLSSLGLAYQNSIGIEIQNITSLDICLQMADR